MFDPDYDLFLQTVEAGSISAAARARGITTAAASKRLARLEDRLGARLVNRTTRRHILTSEGTDLFDTLLPLRMQLKAVEERIAGRGTTIAGPLRITAPTSFGRSHVVPCLPGFLARHPQVELTVLLSDEFIDLLDGGVDLAIRIGARIGTSLIGHRLATNHRVLCAAPSYLAEFGEPSSLDELAGHRLLATDSQLPWQLDGPGGTVQHHGTSHIRTNSSEVIRELALRGCGVALRSMWDVGEELASGYLTRVLPQYRGSQDVGIYAVHCQTPIVPAKVTAMIDHISANLQESEIKAIVSPQ